MEELPDRLQTILEDQMVVLTFQNQTTKVSQSAFRSSNSKKPTVPTATEYPLQTSSSLQLKQSWEELTAPTKSPANGLMAPSKLSSEINSKQEEQQLSDAQITKVSCQMLKKVALTCLESSRSTSLRERTGELQEA